MDTAINTDLGFLSFESVNGTFQTVSLVGLSLVRHHKINHVFYGTKGHAQVEDDIFQKMHALLGFSIPDFSADDSDDSDDFVTPDGD